MIYQFREGSRFAVKAQAAGDELERIRAAAGGGLTPSAVVDESRPEEAPLHPVFEWDDEAAAEKYREDQARHLIRSVHLVVDHGGKEESAQRYVHVVTQESGPVYQVTSVVMADDVLRAQVLNDAMSLLKGLQRRFAHLTELRGVFAAIEQAAAKAGKKRAHARPVEARP